MGERTQIGLRKEIETAHWPVTVASALDSILKPLGYKRLRSKPRAGEFVWKDRQGKRVVVDHYAEANGISCSGEMAGKPEEIGALYTQLTMLLTTLAINIGLKTAVGLTLEVQGQHPETTTAATIPLVKAICLGKEGFPADATVLEATKGSRRVLFSSIYD